MIVTPVASGGWVVRCPGCDMERFAETSLIVGRIGYMHPKECKPRKKPDKKTAPKPRSHASWDDREDSTWIDKL